MLTKWFIYHQILNGIIMFYNTWLINQCLHYSVVPPLMTTDRGTSIVVTSLSRSLGSHNLITTGHKHYKDSSRITIIIQTHLESANLSLNQLSMIPWQLIVNFPSDQALSHLATIPPSSQSWLCTRQPEPIYIKGEYSSKKRLFYKIQNLGWMLSKNLKYVICWAFCNQKMPHFAVFPQTSLSFLPPPWHFE